MWPGLLNTAYESIQTFECVAQKVQHVNPVLELES